MQFQKTHEFLLTFAPLPDSEWKILKKNLISSKVSIGEHLINVGDSPDSIWFVEKGLVKACYLDSQGKEYIRNFCYENSFAIPYRAPLEGIPSDISLVALEPTTVVRFEYSLYQELLTRHWTWQQVGRINAERHYLMRERRQYELLMLTAEERLMAFTRQFPTIVSRISQKDLATYIGVTPESLSRIRAKQKSKGQ